MEQRRRLLTAQRRQRDRRRVRLPAAPARPPGQELGPCGGDDEYRDPGRPVDEVVDEVQQALVRPVEVLEDDDERALLREPLEEPPPRREALDAPIPCRSRFGAVGESEQRLELAGRPTLPRRPPGPRRRPPSAAWPRPAPRALALEDAGCDFRISPSAQNATPSPYGRQRPCRQKMSSGRSSTATKSSWTSRLLPMPGTPTRVIELRRALVLHARERRGQESELALPPDERRARAPRDVGPNRERASTASQTCTGSALPLASTGGASRYSITREVAL